MSEENSLLWKRILAEIEAEVSEANLYTLFKPTGLLSFEKGVVTIAAPSTMIIDLLQKRFYQIIKKAVDKHTGIDAKIIFVPKVIAPPTKSKGNAPLFDQIEENTSQAPIIGHLPRVRPDYTFQTMAVSSSNQLAYVSAKTVSEKLGSTYNPLFIYGPVGVGKTHLMQSIANEVYRKNPNKKIIYITSEEFTNEVVEAIRTNDTARLKKRFRSVDLLIIDDVQFFSGKEKVQEELFHTFNTLVDNGSQVALSSDRPPNEIKKLEKRLSSRFLGGLIVDIDSPDFELRAAIVLIKAKKYGLDLPIEVAKKIAEKTTDTRGLEGLLLRVLTESQTKGVEITTSFVDVALLKNRNEQIYPLHTDDVIRTLCDFYNIKETQLKSPKRSARLVRARQVAMYVLKRELSLSYVEIGNILGGRDHTTIMHGVEKIGNNLVDKKLSGEILGISSLLKNSVAEAQ